MEKLLEAGKIINTHGIKGEVKIQPWTDNAEFLQKFKFLYIDGAPVRLLGGRIHKDCLIARLEGVSNVNDAMVLKNKVVFIDRSEVKLPRGEFFLCDIIGAEVCTEDGVLLGKLTDILEMPAGNIYVVNGEREILIPAVPEFIIKTDIDAGVITVKLIEGM